MNFPQWLFGIVLASLPAWSPAQAATFIVDSLVDGSPSEDAVPGDGICEDVRAGVRCTLRAAIQESNALAGNHRIHFSVAGTFLVLNERLPAIGKRLTIDGRTAPGYDSDGTLAGSPPVVILDGRFLPDNADGLIFRTADATTSDVLALSIVNFGGDGIQTTQSADDLLVQGCYIGIEPDGDAGANGIGINLLGDDNLIGRHGPAGGGSGLGNVISSNTGTGLQILGANNLIRGNRIGATAGGYGSLGNGGIGILLLGADNRIGDLGSAADANIIRNNDGGGIQIIGNGNRVHGNTIDGRAAGEHAIRLMGDDNHVGDMADHGRNHILGFTARGIVLGNESLSSDNNRVVNNAVTLGHIGIEIVNGAENRLISNDIGFNEEFGLLVGAASREASLAGNRIGFVRSGAGTLSAAGNLFTGILDLGEGTRIGIDTSGATNVLRGNIVGFNELHGIELRGTDAWVQGNFVGLTDMEEDIGNLGNGIVVDTAASGTLLRGNSIGNNGFDGISVKGGAVDVCENHIGTSASFTAHGNGLAGIAVFGDGTLIGTSSGCGGNVIGFNRVGGINLLGGANRIEGNWIGVSPDGADLRNRVGGILLNGAGAEDNSVSFNTIAHNRGFGILATNGTGANNRFSGNLFSRNESGGIDLQANGFTPNDPGDADGGPNRMQNFPTVQFVNHVGSQLHVTYRVDSHIDNAAYPLDVEFYLGDGSGTRQGARFLGGFVYSTPLALTIASIDLPMDVPGGELLAIATDADGNSSEVSEAMSFGVVLPPGHLFGDGFESP